MTIKNVYKAGLVKKALTKNICKNNLEEGMILAYPLYIKDNKYYFNKESMLSNIRNNFSNKDKGELVCEIKASGLSSNDVSLIKNNLNQDIPIKEGLSFAPFILSGLFITFFVVAGTFLYFSFVYEVPAHLETESCVEIIEERAGEYLDVPEDLFECIWVDKEGTHVEKMQERIKGTQIINAIILLVASSPLLYMYYYALSRSAKKEKKLFAKLGYLAMGLSVLVVFPPFITDTDYGRWSTYYLMILLLVPAMLTRLQPEGKKWYADMNKPYLIKFYFIAAIALSGLKTFDTFLRALHAFLP